MRKSIVLGLFATAITLVAVDDSDAHFRRRFCPCPCPTPCPTPWVIICPQVVEPTTPAEYFTSPKGKAYRITRSQEAPYEFERRAAGLLPVAAANDDYSGTDRMAAKTSIADGDPTVFAALEDLLDKQLDDAPDKMMRSHAPPITKDPTSDRVKEEQRNVTVTAWLYAAKKEANDNDYHLIIGTDPNGSEIRYMNMEITGLPPAGPTRTKLQVPRQALKNFLAESHLTVNTSSYLRFENPVPVQITGSLFYDIDHLPGVVGSFKEPRRVPATAWEVHPITEIIFEPNP